MKIRTLAASVIVMSLFLLIVAARSFSADLSFEWDQNPDQVTGYKLYYGTASREYSASVDVGLPATVDGKVHGVVKDIPENVEYFYAATAYNHDQESEFSDEVVHTARWSVPVKVGGFKITILVEEQ